MSTNIRVIETDIKTKNNKTIWVECYEQLAWEYDKETIESQIRKAINLVLKEPIDLKTAKTTIDSEHTETKRLILSQRQHYKSKNTVIKNTTINIKNQSIHSPIDIKIITQI